MIIDTFTTRRPFARSLFKDFATFVAICQLAADELIDNFDADLTTFGATRLPGPLHFRVETDDSPVGVPTFALSGPAVMVY